MPERCELVPLGLVPAETIPHVVQDWGVSRLLVERPFAAEPRHAYLLECVLSNAARDDAVSVAALEDGVVVGLSVLRFPLWDEEHFGFRLGRVEHLVARDAEVAGALARGLVRDLAGSDAAFCSARLSADDLPALQALEAVGFHFQEHTLTPWRMLDDWDTRGFSVTRPTDESDIPRLCDIARRAFRTDRFHRDHRFDAAASDGLYEKWVRTWHNRPDPAKLSRVLVVDGHVAGFFMTEVIRPGGQASARVALIVLNAVDPERAGLGLGYRMYCDVLDCVRDEAEYASAVVASANVAVVNLYAKLGFRISTGGEVTLHRWA